MKKVLFIISFVLLIFKLESNAQFTTQDVFDSKIPITWLGVDFTEVKFIGPATGWGEVSTKSSTEMRDKYFPEWNSLIYREQKSFKIEDAVSRPSLEWNQEVAGKANSKINKKEIFSESTGDYQLLKESDIKNIVKGYDLKGKTGIGFVLIAEGMNKIMEEGSYWVTFIDMSSKKVLFTRRVTGKAGGFGFRNYWAGSMKQVFKTMKKEFKKWDN